MDLRPRGGNQPRNAGRGVSRGRSPTPIIRAFRLAPIPPPSSRPMHAPPASPAATPPTPGSPAGLARRLGAFDATMIVMGGIVGAGIFRNPSVVAREVHSPELILAAWAVGGMI